MGFSSVGARVVRAAAGAFMVAAALVACGGGASHSVFAPKRVIVFGDETSVIADTNNDHNGVKYSVNALRTDNVTLDCTSKPIWVQTLAGAYGMVFQQCNTDPSVTARALMLAVPGAKAADLTSQIDAHLAIDALTDTDLVTVLVGTNDILEQYQTYPAQTADAINAELAARGQAVAQQINRIAATGARVLAVTVPDLGQSPLAIKAGLDRQQLLAQFSASFNNALRLGLLNDGRKIGLVLGDELVQGIAVNPTLNGFVNATDAACRSDVVLPNCTTQTLVDNDPTKDYGDTYLWADDTHLSAGGQQKLALAALSRAQNNPF